MVEDMVVQDVETVDQLDEMLKDLAAYGAGPANYEYPPKISMGGEEQPEIDEVFALDIEGLNIDNHYCTDWSWHEAGMHRTRCWADMDAKMRDLFGMVPQKKDTKQLISHI